MKKRLMCLLMAVVMLLSLCMTACSSEEEETGTEEEDVQRKNVALTIYAITDGKTTPDALALVEEKVSNYCVAKYKTAIDLRFFTEAEYQAGLNAMYDKFAEQEAAAKKAAEEAAAAAKSEAAYKATLSVEERREYEQQKRLEAKQKEEEAKKQAEAEKELISQGKDVAVVKDVQMDIIFIPNGTDYASWIKQGLLQDLSGMMESRFKLIRDFVYPSFLTAATVENALYGIPNNHGISTNETYFVFNTALAEKYGVDYSKIKSITDLNDVFAQVKAGEPGVTPIYGDFGIENYTFYEGIANGHMLGAYTENLAGGRFTATDIYSSLKPDSTDPGRDAVVKYAATKALYRENGYLSDTNENFFLSVREMTEEERLSWVEKGYTTVLYKGADFNTEAALQNGLFGISKYCEDPERAMEVLQLIMCDSELRNLLTFGVEDVHYKTDPLNKNVITVIDDSYTMDFFKSGNALIGAVPSTMDPDYVEKAKQKNLNSYMNPFLGFTYDWTEGAEATWVKMFGQWEEYTKDIWAQIHYGTPDYYDLMLTHYQNIYNNTTGEFENSYSEFSSKCNLRANYRAYLKTLQTLDATLNLG